MLSIERISIVGAGNVATQLGKALKTAGLNILEVCNRSAERGEALAKELGASYQADIANLNADSELIILAVSDDAIEDMAKRLTASNAIVVHCSGAVPVQAVSYCSTYGVFYPLQTFTGDSKIEWSELPILLEASSDDVLVALKELAVRLSSRVEILSSEQRKKLHLSAVVVNNFSNHLFAIAQQYAEREGLDFSLLIPLMQETVTKLQSSNAKDIQTGPAHRNDDSTIASHRELLKEDEQLLKLYDFFTESIRSFYS